MFARMRSHILHQIFAPSYFSISIRNTEVPRKLPLTTMPYSICFQSEFPQTRSNCPWDDVYRPAAIVLSFSILRAFFAAGPSVAGRLVAVEADLAGWVQGHDRPGPELLCGSNFGFASKSVNS